MTPKEKAEELIINFFRIQDDVINHETTWHEAKQCALIAVDEHISEHTFKNPIKWNIERINYWKQVKQEIENL